MSDTQTEPCPACGAMLDVTGAQIFAELTCPVCATPINVRRKFGHYELMAVVGSGGQGVVYRAVDNTLNRQVALKLLRTEYSMDPDFVRQFEHEARLTASINHPNVVRVYSFGADEGHVYLAMELVDGGTMDDLMEKMGRIPEPRALQIGIEVAQGLRAGQEKGLIHRDIKPGNVLFSKDGTAKVVDYGLALFFEQAANDTGEIWGTPYYLSPERLNRTPEDFRSDIYSLGAALFHAIAGRPPFEAEDASHVALKHLRSQAVSLATFAPDVSNATAYVVNRTLAKNPDDRQQSYDEFIEQLQFAREEALARKREGGAKKQGRVVLENDDSKKANTWITVATLVMLVIGLTVGGMLIFKGMKGEKEEVGAPAVTAVANLADYGPGWADARDALLRGDFTTAEAAFQVLSDKAAPDSPARPIAQIHVALAAMFSGRKADAASALSKLSGLGTQMGKFFSEQVAPELKTDVRVPAEMTRDFDSRNHQALAALFFGLKDYDLGYTDDAGSLLRQFASYSPEGSSAWIAEYKKLSRPLQDEIDNFVLASNAWNSARNNRERDEAYARIKDFEKNLPPRSKLGPKLKSFLSEVEKRRQADLELKMKSNFAFRSKTTANGFDEQKGDKPENAVDGDPKTRWALKRDGEKWLALDLNSTKTIGRWVVKTAGATGERAENNISELKLQRSDDGKSWVDVDEVKENRFDVIDRVVTPFTARYVRIFSTKGGVKAGDNGFRVGEFEVGPAEEQAKVEYEANQPLAMRFSTASDFQFSPIGEPNGAGSAKYDPQARKYTIRGSGADIWMDVDHYHFAWQTLDGNGEIIARVISLQRIHDWTKVGVMMRAELGKEGAMAFMGAGPDGKMQFGRRKEKGQQATSNNKDKLPLPRWVKLVRQGENLIGFESQDGKNWKEVGRDTVKLPQKVYIGLAVCSHVSGQITEAQFDNVSIHKK